MQLEPAENCRDAQIQLAIVDERVRKTLLCLNSSNSVEAVLHVQTSQSQEPVRQPRGTCPWPLVYQFSLGAMSLFQYRDANNDAFWIWNLRR